MGKKTKKGPQPPAAELEVNARKGRKNRSRRKGKDNLRATPPADTTSSHTPQPLAHESINSVHNGADFKAVEQIEQALATASNTGKAADGSRRFTSTPTISGTHGQAAHKSPKKRIFSRISFALPSETPAKSTTSPPKLLLPTNRAHSDEPPQAPKRRRMTHDDFPATPTSSQYVWDIVSLGLPPTGDTTIPYFTSWQHSWVFSTRQNRWRYDPMVLVNFGKPDYEENVQGRRSWVDGVVSPKNVEEWEREVGRLLSAFEG